MKHDTHAEVPKPFDVYALFGTPGLPFGDAEAAYRAWLDDAKAIQAEATEFFNARVGKDMAAFTDWVQCKSPTEALELQARYATDALSDYVTEGQKMLALASRIRGRTAESQE